MLGPTLLSGRLTGRALLLLTAICAGGAANAAAVNWVGTNGDWNVATNWSSNPALPTVSDDVTINVAGTRTVTIGSTTSAAARSISMTGNESLVIDHGNLQLALGTSSTLNNFSLLSTTATGGNLTGGGVSTIITVTGNANLTGGQVNGANLRLDGISSFAFSSGPTTLFRLGTGGTLRIGSGGTTTWSAGSMNLDTSPATGGGTFTNTGTLIASGAGAKIMENFYGGGTFTNTGLVDVQGGTLLLMGGGSHTGNFVVASGSTLQFGSGGTGAVNSLAAAPSGAGTVEVRGGTVNANGGIATAGLGLNDYNATLAINADSTVTTFNQSAGVLQGSGKLTVAGAATLAGTQRGAATTELQAVTTAAGDNIWLDSGRTLRNAATGTFNWGASAFIDLDSTSAVGGGTLVNEGMFIVAKTFNSQIINTNGGGLFQNNGTLRKTDSFVTTISAPFDNDGAVEVQAGRLVLAGGSATHAGSFDVSNGATLEFNGGTHTAALGPAGTGTVAVDAGTTLAAQGAWTNNGTLAGNGILDPQAGSGLVNANVLSPGNNDIGQLTVAGDLTQTGTGTMVFELASPASYDSLDVLGNLALDGVLQITSYGGFNPNDGDTFTIISFDDGVADASDLAGLFQSVLMGGFLPTVSFDVNYLANSVVLQANVETVPVPGAAWMFTGALSGLLVLRKRAARLKH